MFKFLLLSLICSAMLASGLAIYLLTGENIEKTILVMPAFLSIFYFLYVESNEAPDHDEMVEWLPVSVK